MNYNAVERKVFVSYSHADKKMVLPLVERLERDTGVQFWIDREGIESAAQFEEVIIRAIDQAEVVLFMLSDNSQQSKWTKDEISYAKNTGKRVVPIVLHGGGLEGWFLFKFGRINYIDASQNDQLQRLVQDLRQWLHVEERQKPAENKVDFTKTIPISDTPAVSKPDKKVTVKNLNLKGNAISTFLREHRVGCAVGLTITLTFCLAVVVVLPQMYFVSDTPDLDLAGFIERLDSTELALDSVYTSQKMRITDLNKSLSSSPAPSQEAATGAINITCGPKGSTIKVDGKSVGTTPKEIGGLSVGKHAVEVSKDGYESKSWTVTVRSNTTESISGDLSLEQNETADRIVSGRVLDANGEPLIGAIITIKGNTNYGALTGYDGEFNLNLPTNDATLVITYVGFKTHEISASSDLSSIVLTSEKTETTGVINGHEWVDLGLSVKWATCNVGASSPSGYGNYYAWGETTTKSTYTKENSRTYGKNIGNIAGNASYDAARANWGGTWRLPTKAEMQELVDKCTWTWITQGGHNGCRVTGPNGNSIFLPAAGHHNTTGDRVIEYLANESSSDTGNYWSSEPDGTPKSYFLFFNSKSLQYVLSFRRLIGHSVRPVSE